MGPWSVAILVMGLVPLLEDRGPKGRGKQRPAGALQPMVASLVMS